MGRVEAVELHAKNSTSVEYVRARTWLNAEEPLQFLKRAIFKTGEITQLELTYEKLLKVCFVCKRLTHDMAVCPYAVKEPEPSQMHKRGTKKTGNVMKNMKSDTRGTGTGKGKGIRISNQETEEETAFGYRGKPREVQSPGNNTRSVKDRLQWVNTGMRTSGIRSQKEWRVKEDIPVSRPQAGSSRTTEESGASVSKRRRSSGSTERVYKRARLGESGGKSTSPSVFERLGASSASGEREERRDPGSGGKGPGSGSKGSREKSKLSPSVFERLGSQVSSSSSKEKPVESGHSAQLAARLSHHSASSMAAHGSHSSGSKPADKSNTYWEEGLMVNSNPSKQV